MFVLTKIKMRDTTLFKDVEFVIPQGITAIYGLNQTSAKTSGNANGAGKSMFFSSPGEILWEQPVVGERQDATKKGTRTLELKFGERKFRVSRRGSGLDISVDGKAKKFRTKPLARKFLARNLPISQEEYGTYVHIDARIPHPLVMGSSTERKKFFTSFFGLDKMDFERRLFMAELSKLGKVRAVYTELHGEFNRIKDALLSKEDRKSLNELVIGQATRLEVLQAKNVKLQDIAQLLHFEKSAQTQLKQLIKVLPDFSIANFTDLYEDTEKTAKENRKKLKEAKEYREWLQDTKVYTKAWENLSSDAKKLIQRQGHAEALKRSIARSRAYREARNDLVDLERGKQALEQAASVKIAKVEEPEGDYGDLMEESRSLKHKLEHAQQFAKGKCDSCGQDVKIKNPKVLKERRAQVLAKLEGHKDYEAYKQECVDRKKARQELEEMQAKATEYAETMYRNIRYSAIRQELAELPQEPEPFEGPKLELYVMQRMVDEDQELVRLLDFIHPNLDTVNALYNLTEKQRASGDMAPRLRNAINELHEKLSKNRVKQELDDNRIEDAKRLATKLKAMKIELADEEPLKLLIEGYSDKQMKRMAVRMISNRLMAEVNKYARQVFPEDFTFEFKWETSQLSLIVNRKYGKRIESSDVRKLSGAESKLFTFVLVLALLTFVPHHKRSNVMILDEPAANFGPETLESFKKLLPVLNTVIPSIIVIDPKSEHRYEGAKEFTMVKRDGYGSLIEGHPSLHMKKVRK